MTVYIDLPAVLSLFNAPGRSVLGPASVALALFPRAGIAEMNAARLAMEELESVGVLVEFSRGLYRLARPADIVATYATKVVLSA